MPASAGSRAVATSLSRSLHSSVGGWSPQDRSDAIAKPPLAAVDGDGDEDDPAVDDVLHGLAGAVPDEDRDEHGEEHRADGGAGVVAGSAEDGSADDHR